MHDGPENHSEPGTDRCTAGTEETQGVRKRSEITCWSPERRERGNGTEAIFKENFLQLMNDVEGQRPGLWELLKQNTRPAG